MHNLQAFDKITKICRTGFEFLKQENISPAFWYGATPYNARHNKRKTYIFHMTDMTHILQEKM